MPQPKTSSGRRRESVPLSLKSATPIPEYPLADTIGSPVCRCLPPASDRAKHVRGLSVRLRIHEERTPPAWGLHPPASRSELARNDTCLLWEAATETGCAVQALWGATPVGRVVVLRQGQSDTQPRTLRSRAQKNRCWTGCALRTSQHGLRGILPSVLGIRYTPVYSAGRAGHSQAPSTPGWFAKASVRVQRFSLSINQSSHIERCLCLSDALSLLPAVLSSAGVPNDWNGSGADPRAAEPGQQLLGEHDDDGL